MNDRLQLRSQGTAVVTGAAAGIGAGLCTELAASGYRVVGFDLALDGLEATAASVTSSGGVMEVVTGDVRDDADFARLADVAGPDVSVVVANAGVALGGHYESIPIEDWHRLYDINVLGTVRAFRTFLPQLRAAGQGRLVAIASGAGLFPDDPAAGPYASTKAAIIAMCRSLAVQVAPNGITVTVACPRLTATAFPHTAVAWTPKGKVVPPPCDLSDADTVADVVTATLGAMSRGSFLVSMTPDTRAKLIDFATDPDRYLASLRTPPQTTSTKAER
jgi:NAD(P)-dependent dehydrogenase (short-subunit alcohol dehydrogenase family)